MTLRKSRIFLFSIFILLSGCSSVVQFEEGTQISTVKRKVINGPDGPVLTIDLDENYNPIPVYLSLPQVQVALDLLSNAYVEASTKDRNSRTYIDSAVITSAVAAIWTGLINENTLDAQKIALTGAFIALIGQRVNNPAYGQIYLQGAAALSCVQDASLKASAANPKLFEIATLLTTQQKDMSRLKNDLKLTEQILGQLEDRLKEQLNSELLQEQLNSELLLEQIQNKLLSLRTNSSSQIDYGVSLANTIHANLMTLDPRGRQLLNKARDVHIQVEQELNFNEPRMLSFNAALEQVFDNAGRAAILDFSSLSLPDSTKGAPTSPQTEAGETATISAEKFVSDVAEAGAEATVKTALKAASKSYFEAFQALEQTNIMLVTKITELANAPIKFTEISYEDCQFAPPKLRRDLHLSQERIEIEVSGSEKVKARFDIQIVGGFPGYTVIEDGLPEGVDTTISIWSGGSLLTLNLDISQTNLPFSVVLSDSRGSQRSLLIVKKGGGGEEEEEEEEEEGIIGIGGPEIQLGLDFPNHQLQTSLRFLVENHSEILGESQEMLTVDGILTKNDGSESDTMKVLKVFYQQKFPNEDLPESISNEVISKVLDEFIKEYPDDKSWSDLEKNVNPSDETGADFENFKTEFYKKLEENDVTIKEENQADSFNTSLRNHIRKYQEKINSEITGYLDNGTWEALELG